MKATSQRIEKNDRKRVVEGLKPNPVTRQKSNRAERRDVQRSLKSFIHNQQDANEWGEDLAE